MEENDLSLNAQQTIKGRPQNELDLINQDYIGFSGICISALKNCNQPRFNNQTMTHKIVQINEQMHKKTNISSH